MEKLEKILQEIEEKKEKYLSVLKTEVDPMELTIHREQYKEIRIAEDVVKKHMMDDNGWIPVNQDAEKENLPNSGQYVLVSFENLEMIDIGRYEEDEEGGAFYAGDKDTTYSKFGIVVNAWRPIPKPYRQEDRYVGNDQ